MALRGALITHRLRRPTRHPWRADWLLGCGERPWHTLFPGAWCIGLDRGFEGASAGVLAEAAALPFADHS